MKRFNKEQKEARRQIIEELDYQYTYKSAQANKLVRFIVFFGFAAAGIAIYKLSGGIDGMKTEQFDDNNSDNVLNEAKILLQQNKDDLRHKK